MVKQNPHANTAVSTLHNNFNSASVRLSPESRGKGDVPGLSGCWYKLNEPGWRTSGESLTGTLFPKRRRQFVTIRPDPHLTLSH